MEIDLFWGKNLGTAACLYMMANCALFLTVVLQGLSLPGEFCVENRFDPRIFNKNIYVFSIFIHCGVDVFHSPASFGDDHLCINIMKFRPQISLVQINFDSLHALRARIKKQSKLLLIFNLIFLCLNMPTDANNIIT